MKSMTAKHAVWCIRILSGKVIEYSFKSRGETVNASRFECVTVSKNPMEYMFASFPFSFGDRGGAKKALDKFTDNSVWILNTTAFATKSKPEYNSCPLKTVVLLTQPSRLVAATPAHM